MISGVVPSCSERHGGFPEAGAQMASRWIVYKQGEASLAFGEMVALARAGQLDEEDLVKADWEPEWRPAHTVVGLFYRVRRTETDRLTVPAPTGASSTEASPSASLCSSETAFSWDDISAELHLEAAGEWEQSPTADPHWMQRYREVTEQRASAAAQLAPVALPETSPIHVLVDEVVAAQERRAAFRARLFHWQGRWDRGRKLASSPVVFRVACAAFVAVIVCLSLATWSRQTALRFPQPGRPDRYVVPGLGDCTPKEFGVVLAELALASAVVGYLGAKRIEVWADT